MKNLILTLLIFLSPNLLFAQETKPADPTAQTVKDPDLKSRSFKFRYAAKIADLPDGANVKIWIPIAETNRQQKVEVSIVNGPSQIKYDRDEEYNNRIGSFEFTVDPSVPDSFEVVYDVLRRPAVPYQDDASAEQKQDGKAMSRYLKPNRTVPLTGKPIELIKGMTLPENGNQKARKLYDLVYDHMAYDKSKPGYGNGDSVWACQSGTGNCTDFHSLFISLSRSQSLASRFEIGFPLPSDRKSGKIGGYHCWAWFLSPDAGWTPVDISEADKHPEMKDQLFGHLPPDRISFSTGRDIVLKPKSAAGPLNFFVYPHVEVDGKVWPKEKIELDFSFEDTEQR